MTVNNRRILVLPFALEDDLLRMKSDFLGRQLPIYLRNCFEKHEHGRVVASPIATDKEDQRYWVVHHEMWNDEAARNFARSRDFDIVVFGILSGPSSEGSIRTLKLRSVMVETGKVVIDKTITGDIFRIIRTSLEGMSVYASMIPRDAAALFDPETESAPAFENYLRGLDVLLALRSEGIALNDYDKILEPFDRAIRIDPHFASARTAGLSCALQAMEIEGHEVAIETLRSTLNGWIDRDREDPRGYAVLAEVLLGREQTQDALDVLRLGIDRIEPTNRDLIRRSGDALSDLGRHEEALEAYEACEEIYHDAALVERMSALNIMVGRAGLAREQLEGLLEEDASRVDIWLRVGLLAQRAGDHEGAFAAFAHMFEFERAPGESELTKLNAVLSKSPPDESFRSHLTSWYPPESFGTSRRLLFAKTLRLVGARMEAGLCLNTVRVDDLSAADRALLARERLNLLDESFDANFAELAKSIVNQGSTEGRKLLDDAVAHQPDFWPARFLRGLIFSKLGEYEESLAELDIVLDMEPENDVVWYTRGLQLVKLGQDEDAARSFKSAIRLNGKESDYHANLALTCARLRDEDGAREALDEVLALRPTHPDNQRLQQAVDESLGESYGESYGESCGED